MSNGKYDLQVSNLPDYMHERFMHIRSEVFGKAKRAGWYPELDDNDRQGQTRDLPHWPLGSQMMM